MGDLIETVQIAARIPVELRDKLEELAKADDRNLSYLVRQALSAYVEARGQEEAA